jgi:hypothetical protein
MEQSLPGREERAWSAETEGARRATRVSTGGGTGVEALAPEHGAAVVDADLEGGGGLVQVLYRVRHRAVRGAAGPPLRFFTAYLGWISRDPVPGPGWKGGLAWAGAQASRSPAILDGAG